MFVHIGYDHFVNADQLECFMPPQSQSTKRKVAQAKKAGFFHDCTLGKGWKSVLIMNNGHIYASHLTSTTIVSRIHTGHWGKENYEKAVMIPSVFSPNNDPVEVETISNDDIIPMVIDADHPLTLEQRLAKMGEDAGAVYERKLDEE